MNDYGEATCWYVLRVTYGRELKVRDYLESCAVETFVPMHYEERNQVGKPVRMLVPMVHNLVFARVSKSRMRELKEDPYLSVMVRYMMDAATNLPLVVPDKQMADFMAVAGRYDESLVYLSPDDLRLRRGDRVRINSGIWKGVVGQLVRIKKNLHVVVCVKGLMAVGTVCLRPSMIDKLSNEWL